MTNVRKAAATTAILYVIAAIIAILTIMSNNPDDVFVSRMHLMLESRSSIGVLHSLLLGFSFWVLLISSVVDVIYRDKKGLAIIGGFGIPLGLTGYVVIWVLVSLATPIDLRIFWLCYYIAMIVCTKLAFNSVSKADGSAPSKLGEFFKSPPSKVSSNVNIIDRYVLFSTQAVLLVLLLIQIIMTIVFCVQYSEMFAFV